MDRKKIVITTILSVFVIFAIIVVYDHFTYVSTENAQIDGHFLMLAPKVPGFVVKVNVTEGQLVKKDDILAEIDPRDFENSTKQFQAELSSIEAKEKDAERNFRRLMELYSKGAVSQQQYDTASTSFHELQAKYNSISAQVAQAQLNLENTKIKAPADGIVARKSVEIGQLAAAGLPLFGFVDTGERWVTANFKETELEGIKVGHQAKITVDALSGKSFDAEVVSLSPSTGATFTLLPPDNATGNFTKVVQRVPVKIQLKNLTPDDIQDLRVGLSATVKVRKH